MREHVERRIARKVVRDALAAGYALNINNGGDEHELPVPSTNFKVIFEAMFATGEDYLLLFKNGERDGWVRLIYGNGADVISDFTTNLEDLMAGANALADKYGD